MGAYKTKKRRSNCLEEDLNFRHEDFQSSALTNWATWTTSQNLYFFFFPKICFTKKGKILFYNMTRKTHSVFLVSLVSLVSLYRDTYCCFFTVVSLLESLFLCFLSIVFGKLFNNRETKKSGSIFCFHNFKKIFFWNIFVRKQQYVLLIFL